MYAHVICIADPDAEWKALFMETKRCILYIIRVQSGANLMDILVTPITADDERRWQAILQEEFSGSVGEQQQQQQQQHQRRRGAYYTDSHHHHHHHHQHHHPASAAAAALGDVSSMTYAELKRTALENIVQLERAGRVSRHNHYQDLLNAIAVDIRTKHRRRVQRQRELEGVRLTLANLNEKALWLEQQLKSYNDYIEQAMVTLQNKKGCVCYFFFSFPMNSKVSKKKISLQRPSLFFCTPSMMFFFSNPKPQPRKIGGGGGGGPRRRRGE